MKSTTKKKYNYIFIIESNNDLDMLSPIIWKFASDNSGNIFVINTSPGLLSANDRRIIFIRKNSSVKYIEISKDFKILDDISIYIYSKLKVGYFHRRYLNSLLRYSLKKFEKIPISKELPSVIFVSYFLDHNAVKSAIAWAEKHKFVKVFNNHGITPFVVDKKPDHDIEAPLFNICIFNKNSEKNLTYFEDKNTEKIYSVPRFSKEWCDKLSEIYPKKITNINDRKFRATFMLSKWLKRDDKEKILSAINIVSKIENIEVIIKPHTRGMVIDEEFPLNVLIADEEYHSRQIIQDSDVVIFTRSSIFLDAMLLNKAVLHLSYATKVDLASKDLNSCKIYNQQDLVSKLNDIRNYGPLYSSKDRENCINFYAGKDDGKMLDNVISKIKLITDRLSK